MADGQISYGRWLSRVVFGWVGEGIVVSRPAAQRQCVGLEGERARERRPLPQEGVAHERECRRPVLSVVVRKNERSVRWMSVVVVRLFIIVVICMSALREQLEHARQRAERLRAWTIVAVAPPDFEPRMRLAHEAHIGGECWPA